MPQLTFKNQTFQSEKDESVLDCLLRHDQQIPHACKKGTCHSCYMRAESGDIPDTAQRGLKETEITQGYFLSCSCVPSTDMTVTLPNSADTSHEAEIVAKEMVSSDVVRLRLRLRELLEYRAGQFINLYKDEYTLRSYSLASVPELDDFIELHIKRYVNGHVSGWVHDDLNVGDKVKVSGALGNTFYLKGRPEQPMMLIGTGTGLAPLYGIVRDALNQGHSGDIHLFHGSRGVDGLYLMGELMALDIKYPNFTYYPCASGDEQAEGVTHGRANEVALQTFPALKDWRIFLCGNPQMVEQAKLKTYLAGASLGDILADPFTPAEE